MGTSVLGQGSLADGHLSSQGRERKKRNTESKNYGCAPQVALGVAHETTPQLVAMSSGVLPEASTP